MTPEARQQADAYFETSRGWAQDLNDELRRSRRTAWIVAITACACTVLAILAVFALLPLKTVTPYTLLVDRQTGYVQALDPIDAARITPDAALTQSFLVQYVIARESFNRATVQADYRKVTLWSADGAERDYVRTMQVANPASPLASLPPGTSVEARIRSVSSLGKQTSLVRFDTQQRDRGGALQPAQAFAAVVSWRYSNTPMSVEDRFINPLGFEVVRYRKNPETLAVPQQVEAAPIAGALTGAARAPATPLPAAPAPPSSLRP
jgi:type IV secretion system protein VirB8